MKNCIMCDNECDVENGDIVGSIGITQVAFCIDCYSGIRSMVVTIEQFKEKE